jgi:uncharacterized damage-inducible protein DinB
MNASMVIRGVALGALMFQAGGVGLAAPQAPEPISTALRQAWQAARLNVKESADVMPEANYNFKPVDTVRSFSQILTHLAGANYVFCSAALGQAAPHAEDAFEGKVTARAEIIRVLGESLAYCDRAYETATDRSLTEMVAQPFSGAQGPRAATLVSNVGHLNEHYGNLVTYFRLNGLVPPSSRR